MGWEQSDGVGRLGRTLPFAILVALGLSSLAHDLPAWLGAVAASAALATFVFPLLIGMLFPADNWRWGPCLSMVIALIMLLVIPATGPRSEECAQSSWRSETESKTPVFETCFRRIDLVAATRIDGR